MKIFSAKALLCFLSAGVQITSSASSNRAFNATELYILRSDIVALEQKYSYNANYARELASMNQEFLVQAKRNARVLHELADDFDVAVRLIQEQRMSVERFINSTIT